MEFARKSRPTCESCWRCWCRGRKKYLETYKQKYPEAQLVSYLYNMCDLETRRWVTPHVGVGASFENVKRRVLDYANSLEAPDTGAKPMELGALGECDLAEFLIAPETTPAIQNKEPERDKDGYSPDDWRLWSLQTCVELRRCQGRQ